MKSGEGRVGVLFLALLGLVSLMWPSGVLAASNGTTIGVLTLTPSFEAISVYANFTGDDNRNSRATLEYRQSGGSWLTGMDMVVDKRTTIVDEDGSHSNPYVNQWRTVILGLIENTGYEVRMTYTDADGVSGSNPVVGTVTTRNGNPPSSGVNYYVSTSGANANNGLTTTTAWRNIGYAMGRVSAGDIINVMPGAYYPTNEGGLTITASGTDNNWITIRSYDLNNKAIVNFQNGDSETAFEIEANYIRIKGLDLRNPSDWLLTVGEGHHDVIFEDNVTVGSSESYWAGNGVYAQAGSGRVTLQRNTMRCTATTDGDQTAFLSLASPSGDGSGTETMGGNVIRNNTIGDLSGGGNWHDIVSGGNNGKMFGSASKDMFIYGNAMYGGIDDLVGCANGEALNSAIYNNTMIGLGSTLTGQYYNQTGHAANGVSITPALIGPEYVIHNLMVGGAGSSLFKQGGESTWSNGYVFAYNNTAWSDYYVNGNGTGFGANDAGYPGAGSGGTYWNHIFKNNIIVSAHAIHDEPWSAENAAAQLYHNSYDYNDIILSGGGFGTWWNGDYYTSHTSWKAANGGNDTHGKSADPVFIARASNNYNLQSGSPCIDAGVQITGVNTANSPWPFSGAAPDIGAYEYQSGGTTPPSVSTGSASSITSSSAVLNGTLTSLGSSGSITVSFEYGTSTSYGSTTSTQTLTATGAFSATVSSLAPNTTYHFRSKAMGSGTAYGNDATVTTSAGSTPPTITTGTASSITSNAAILNGNLTSLGSAGSVTVSLEYGTSVSYGSTTSTQTMTAAGVFSASIGSLSPVTTYHFRAKAVGTSTVYGTDQTFTTSASVANWDVNQDGMANVLDVILIGQHWGQTGTAGWIREDVNMDGKVDVLDTILVGQHWTG